MANTLVQKALASVTAPVMRTAKKSKHKQTNKKHRKETQNKIKNVSSLCISCFGFIYVKPEKCQRRTKASKKLVKSFNFFPSRASLAWVKGTEKSRIPRT